jgi:hypothetical protein
MTNQRAGLLVTIPQTSHLNSCIDAICFLPFPFSPLDHIARLREECQRKSRRKSPVGTGRFVLLNEARDFVLGDSQLPLPMAEPTPVWALIFPTTTMRRRQCVPCAMATAMEAEICLRNVTEMLRRPSTFPADQLCGVSRTAVMPGIWARL